MDIARKLQLSAAAVIANGLLALTALAPTTALADSCSDHNSIECDGCFGSSCPVVSGCTASQQCVYDATGNICLPGLYFSICTYS